MLNQDFKEFVESLNESDVRYLIVGGYAVAAHGRPRYTKDLDVWIEASQKNAERLILALEQFGFGSLGLKAVDFLIPDQIVQLGYPPSRVDILTTLEGVDFEPCYASRVSLEIENVVVHFIDLENLKRNKRSVGRLQDLADLENLQ